MLAQQALVGQLARVLAGDARLAEPVGRLAGGGQGTLAVEVFSAELLPRGRTLTAREAQTDPGRTRIPVRSWLWLFGVGVVAFSGEWLARRRLGLR